MFRATGARSRAPLLVAVLVVASVAAVAMYNSAGKTEAGGLNLQITKHHSVTTKASPSGIAWSPNGEKVAAIYDFGRAISVWNSIGNAIVTIKRENTTGPYVGSSLSFLPDNRTILAPAPTPDQKNISSLGLWDAETGALLRVVPESSSEKSFQATVARTFSVSPDGTLVAVTPIQNQQPIAIYNTRDWSLVNTRQILASETTGLKPAPLTGVTPKDFPTSVETMAFAPNNDLAIGLVSGLVIMGAEPSSTTFRFVDSSYERMSRAIRCVAFSSNGKFLATGISTGRVLPDNSPEAQLAKLQIRDVLSARVVADDNTIGDVRNLAWDRDGKTLAVVTASEGLRIYRPFESGGAHQDVAVSKGAFALSFSPANSELAVTTQTGIDFYSIK